MNKQVALIFNKNFISLSDSFIPTKNRNQMVYSLIDVCGLLNKVSVCKSEAATFDQLHYFHSKEYLNFLAQQHDELEIDSDDEAEFGFGYDCPLKPGIFNYCLQVAGGSISAAKLLCLKKFDVVMHWSGGWHHAKRNEAAGYCYINDCVLAILQLRKTFSKVLYIDYDLHHGDGVQDAFYGTDKVMTFSIHKYESGFFPGSGSIKEIGFGKGKYFSINLPLHDGIQDESFIAVCQKALSKVKEKFVPEAVVCQVGADGLNEDPMQSFNLTSKAFVQCIKQVVDWNLPTLILGGGGYNEANVARCWTEVTASLVNETLPDDIPEHEFFPCYGPNFDFKIDRSFKKDMNSNKYLTDVVDNIIFNLNQI